MGREVESTRLAPFVARSGKDMAPRHRGILGGSLVGRGDGCSPDVTARELQCRQGCELAVVERIGEWREGLAPDALSSSEVRCREFDDEVESPLEGLVEVCAHVRREDRKPLESLDALEEVGDLDVRVAVAGIRDPRALPEERIRLVEEQDAVVVLDELLTSTSDLAPMRESTRLPVC